MRLLARGSYALAALVIVLAWSTPLSFETYADFSKPVCAPNLGVLPFYLAGSGVVAALLGVIGSGRDRRTSLVLAGLLIVTGVGRCALTVIQVAQNDRAYRAASGGFPCDR
ncbi:hypothetical protein [Deinococcus apachensis]|uniref:hypothetical protein n=1 Tax=Deinococcus apachensis TaxID=309886 RepID=UPI00036E63C8|nr:hypothetical protein [Deinococcus apachensis]